MVSWSWVRIAVFDGLDCMGERRARVLLGATITLLCLALYVRVGRVAYLEGLQPQGPVLGGARLVVPTVLHVRDWQPMVVEPGVYEGGDWSVSDQGVSYWVSSSGLDEMGNVVLYGHNKAGILRDLPTLRIGDILLVEGSDTQVRRYRVSVSEEVAVDAVEWLGLTETETITVYTCSGWWNTKRWMVQATRVG